MALPRIRQRGSLTWPSLPQPQTPHLEEDLKEVLRSEAGIELTIEDQVRPEKQKRKAGVSGRGGQCGRSRGRQEVAGSTSGQLVKVRRCREVELPQSLAPRMVIHETGHGEALVSGTLPSAWDCPLAVQQCVPCAAGPGWVQGREQCRPGVVAPSWSSVGRHPGDSVHVAERDTEFSKRNPSEGAGRRLGRSRVSSGEVESWQAPWSGTPGGRGRGRRPPRPASPPLPFLWFPDSRSSLCSFPPRLSSEERQEDGNGSGWQVAVMGSEWGKVGRRLGGPPGWGHGVL